MVLPLRPATQKLNEIHCIIILYAIDKMTDRLLLCVHISVLEIVLVIKLRLFPFFYTKYDKIITF